MESASPVCNKKFIDTELLEVHVNSHFEVACPFCEFAGSHEEVSVHVAACHSEEK